MCENEKIIRTGRMHNLMLLSNEYNAAFWSRNNILFHFKILNN